MIKTIIFDFGDVFINLDKTAIPRELSKLGIPELPESYQKINDLYETGKIATEEFLRHYKELIPSISEKQIIDLWNSMLKDFPKYRLDFLKQLKLENKYQLLLLSNTNELHIQWIKDHISFYTEFKNCFDAFYLSHEIQLRKPTTEIFQFVLDHHKIEPKETLFIDDTTENTTTAEKMGIHIWNNNPIKQDVTNLYTIKSDLF